MSDPVIAHAVEEPNRPWMTTSTGYIVDV